MQQTNEEPVVRLQSIESRPTVPGMSGDIPEDSQFLRQLKKRISRFPAKSMTVLLAAISIMRGAWQGQMQRKRNFVTALALVALVILIPGQMTAQLGSKPGTVTLIAIVPERLSMRVNPNNIPGSSSALNSSSGEIAASVTTSWSLLPGRAQVVTWAHVVDTSPVLLAAAMDIGGNPFTGGGAGFPRYPIPVSNPTLQLKLGSTNLTEPGRTSADTVDLPLEINEARVPLLPRDPAAGTVKIQVQALP